MYVCMRAYVCLCISNPYVCVCVSDVRVGCKSAMIYDTRMNELLHIYSSKLRLQLHWFTRRCWSGDALSSRRAGRISSCLMRRAEMRQDYAAFVSLTLIREERIRWTCDCIYRCNLFAAVWVSRRKFCGVCTSLKRDFQRWRRGVPWNARIYIMCPVILVIFRQDTRIWEIKCKITQF